MQDLTKLDPQVADQFRNIANQREQEQQLTLASAEDTVDFYLKSYPFVQIVKCLNCNEDLCLWVLDPTQVKKNMHVHPLGLRRIQVSNSLFSTRKRHDGVMGYLCACGNDSRLSSIEKNIVPTAKGIIPPDEPHIEALVKKKMLAENYSPKIELIDGKEVIEGFEHTILKGQK